MERRDHRPEYGEDELDQLIRETLVTRSASARPPDRVWQRISEQVSAGPSPHRRPPAVRLRHVFAPLMQGLAATAVLLLLGLSLGPNLWVTSYQFGAQDQMALPAPATSHLNPADYGLAPAIVSAVSAAPLPPPGPVLALDARAEDMLSAGVVLARAAPAEPEAGEVLEPASSPESEASPVVVQANDPALDPLLANRHALAADLR